MSFFYDLMQTFNLSEIDEKTTISFILDVGVQIVGKFKIIDINENRLLIKSFNEQICIDGENFVIKTMSKGEIVILGKVIKIERCRLWKMKFVLKFQD